MNVTGTIKRIGDVQQVSNSFSKRELVLTTQEQYPQHLSIEFTQNNTALLDTFNEGQAVTIDINLRGREWTSPGGEVKYFNSIQGWRITPQQTAAPTPPQPAPAAPAAPAASEEDDRPF